MSGPVLQALYATMSPLATGLPAMSPPAHCGLDTSSNKGHKRVRMCEVLRLRDLTPSLHPLDGVPCLN